MVEKKFFYRSKLERANYINTDGTESMMISLINSNLPAFNCTENESCELFTRLRVVLHLFKNLCLFAYVVRYFCKILPQLVYVLRYTLHILRYNLCDAKKQQWIIFIVATFLLK